jgi:hypothetical protein
LDKDGVAEIVVKGCRSDIRDPAWDTGLIHWKDGAYKIWWPDWSSPPYVMGAELVDVDHDQQKELIAVLDVGGESVLRELGVWKLTKGIFTLWKPTFTLVDKVKLPAREYLWSPTISKILPTSHGAEIELEYPENKTLKYIYLNGKITWSETESR